MKRYLSVLFALLCLCLPQAVRAQDYAELWQRFAKAYDSDLPASALEVLHTIRQKAIAGNDDAQLLRALTTECVVARDISPDSAEVTERRVREAMVRETRPVERALWRSAYGQLANNADSLLASVAQPELLADACTDDYATLFDKGADSRWMHHDLLSLLTQVVMDSRGFRGVSQRDADGAWQRMREVYARRGNEVALLLMRYREMQDSSPTDAEIGGFIAEINRLMPKIKGTNVGTVMKNYVDNAVAPKVDLWLKTPESGTLYPGKPCPLYLQTRHVRRAEVRVWLLQGITGRDLLPSVTYDIDAKRALCNRAKPLLKQTIRVPQHEIPDYVTAKDTLSLSISEPGIYKIEVREDGKIRDFTVVSCTRVAPLFFRYYKGTDCRVSLTLVDAYSGEPLRQECALEYASAPGRRLAPRVSWKALQESSPGSFRLDDKKDLIFHAKAGKDVYFPTFDMTCYGRGYVPVQKMQAMTRIYTDRALYRPGQQVRYGGVVYSQLGDVLQAIPDWKGKISLLDSRQKEIGSAAVSTDETGDFSGTFDLPNPLTPGSYRLHLTGNDMSRSMYIRVEEYKRPTFRVELQVPSPDSLYQRPQWELGDTLTLKGTVKTYSGVPVSGASVQWTTTRTLNFWRSSDADAKVEGTAETDDAGTFEIGVRLRDISDETVENGGRFPWLTFRFDTHCIVTAPNGESEQASRSVVARRPAPAGTVEEPGQPVASAEVSDDATHGTLTLRRPGAWVYYDVVSALGEIVASQVLQVTDSVRFDVEWAASYGDAATAYMAWMHEGHFDSRMVKVERPKPDKRLLLSWATFRDNLQPGQEETWTLTVRRPDGTPADAVVMARLYDASLDALEKSDWTFGVNFQRYMGLVARERQGYDFVDRLSYLSPQKYAGLKFSIWKPSMISYYGGRGRNYFVYESATNAAPAPMARTMGLGTMKQKAVMADFAAADAVAGEAVLEESAVEEKKSAAESEESAAESGESAAEMMAVRSNFDETAFFMPSLRTDAEGNVTMQFTLPEKLTQWNFSAFAHDGAMNYGLLSDTVVARKELMVEIAAPRFLRHGDRTDIPVTVRNLSGRDCRGTLHFFLADAASGRKLQAGDNRFDLRPGASSVVTFSVNADLAKLGIPADSIDNSDLLAEAMAQLLVKAVAVADTDAEGHASSDGEQWGIPLLSGRVMVETAVPFTLQGKGARDIDVSALNLKQLTKADPLSRPEVTVDYTDNPLWSVVRAVPALLDEETLSANSLALRLYIVEMARYLTEHVAGVDSLLPPGASIEALRHSAHDLLKDRQHADGGFGWMPGSHSSLWTTVDVALLLARQQRLTGSDIAAEMLGKAMKYMEREAERAVADMKKAKHTGDISETLLRYLYVRTLLDLNPRAAEEYLLGFVTDSKKSLTMYGKGVQAQVLARAAAGKVSQKLAASCIVAADLAMQSLVEHTVATPEMGRYFDTPRAERGWKSYRIPTQVMALEALSNKNLQAYGQGWLAKQDIPALQREMMLWLLQSKRTQQWESSRASADATYALLRGYGSEGQTFQPLTPEGRWQRTLSPQEVQKLAAAGNYRLAAGHDGVAWGSVRVRYSTHVSGVEYAGSGLAVERSWQVWQDGQWKDLPDGAGAQARLLKVGAKVRQVLHVTADRDFDFVCLEAGRPACMEPLQALSGSFGAGSLWAYRMVRDVRNDYYIEHLPKGKHTLAEEYIVDRSGRFSTGLVHIACAYAPEFAGYAPSSTLESGAK